MHAVVDVRAAELVLGRAECVGSATARYGARNWFDGMPVTSDQCRSARVEIETLVQVDPHAEPRLVDRRRSAAATRRRTATIAGSVFANLTVAIALRTLAGVERDAGDEEGVVAQRADALDALGVAARRSARAWLRGRDAGGVAGRCGASTA